MEIFWLIVPWGDKLVMCWPYNWLGPALESLIDKRRTESYWQSPLPIFVVTVLKIAIFGSSGGGGGQSYLLTFYSDDLSLNPTEAYSFSCKI